MAVESAQLQAELNREEQKARIAGEITRIEEENKLQSKRIELITKREEAETVIPAEARKRALILEAEGQAAKILEDGRSTAKAVALMHEEWKNESSKDLFLIQMYPDLLDKVTRVVSENLNIEKLTILDSGDGKGLSAYVKTLANSASVMIEHLKNTTGVDFSTLGRSSGEESNVDLPKDLK